MIALEGMFDLLGWKVAMSEEKRKAFTDISVSLGAQLDFRRAQEGDIVLSNKPGRVEAIISQ
eukprot:6552397-Karenia_brevis.AAC.1